MLCVHWDGTCEICPLLTHLYYHTFTPSQDGGFGEMAMFANEGNVDAGAEKSDRMVSDKISCGKYR